jgi:tetratricopeptide (TPR) repeat protein
VWNKENYNDIDLTSLYNILNENNFKVWDGWIHSSIAEILLKIDNNRIVEAENFIKKAIEIDKINGVSINLGKNYALYAELFKQKGSQFEAIENLKSAIDIFRNSGAEGWAVKFENDLDSIS